MEKESFEDEEAAHILNQNYICIKVDREERPDIDNIYMEYCQLLTGSGGWPLSIFLTPGKKPFYAGTYFPKEPKFGHIGFINILEQISYKWQRNYIDIVDTSEAFYNKIKDLDKTTLEEVNEKAYDEAYEYFRRNYDSIYGGFALEPKFPSPHHLMYLLRYYKIHNDNKALEMVEKTLISMYKGGIFDHVGYGFSRYSTDKKWLIPHFEKMLYDNAMLIIAYSECYQITKKEIYKEVVEKIIVFLCKDLMTEEGAFCSALDADSEGQEGKFYVFTKEEVIQLLGRGDGELYCNAFDITEGGNFEGSNIVNLIHNDLDQSFNEDLLERLNGLRKLVYDYREKRVHPFKDDKILTSWNGLTCVALTIAGRILHNDNYISYAKKCIEFLEEKLIREDGRLLARYREGEAKHLGYIDDYAYLTWAYIELYETIYEARYIDKAIRLTDKTIDLFLDIENDGFYFYGKDAENLIRRPKQLYDGAYPSGNGVMAYNLIRLDRITGKAGYTQILDKLILGFGEKINRSPVAYTFTLMAKMICDGRGKEVVIVGEREEENVENIIDIINETFMPFTIILLNNHEALNSNLNPFLKTQEKIDNKVTTYICENFSCKQPVTSNEELKEMIK